MLKDIIPARYRKTVYAVVTLAATIFGIWQASNGDWSTFVAALLTAATTGLATANTDGPLVKKDDGAVEPGSLALGLLVGGAVIYLIFR